MSDESVARQVIAELRAEGALVRLVDGQLRVRAKPGVLTNERRATIQANTREIVDLLRTHVCSRCHRGVFPSAGVICFRCRKTTEGPEAA